MSSAGVKLLRRSLTSFLRRHVTRQEVRYLSRCQIKWGLSCELKGDQRLLSLHRGCRPFSTATSTRVTDDKTVIPVFLKAEEYGDKTAVVSQHGHYSYDDLLNYSANLARDIVTYLQTWSSLDPKGQASNREDGLPLAGERIAFLCDNDLSYVVTKWAVWMCGAIAVPLCKSHPTSELQYFVHDSGACLVLSTETYKDKTDTLCKALGLPYKVVQQDSFSGDYDNTVSAWTHEQGIGGSWTMKKAMYTTLETNSYKDRKAMIIYTSGTTGRPKGVVHTFRNLDAMMQSMISAWGWTADDIILHVLPLHHVHGVVNILMTSLYRGATCVMLPGFDAQTTWRSLVSHSPPVNVFMAVPTIYARLIAEYDRQLDSDHPYLPSDLKQIMQQNIRLMVSGSAALPQPIMARWEEITGHTLLERYGMTEIGMALTNPLLSQRIPGTVGMPFPGVEVSIVGHSEDKEGNKTLVTANSNKATIAPGTEGESGELLVKGDNVFSEYWNKPEETADTFTEDGWFKTGDTAMFIDSAFKIVGRTSVDVIKSGGYKISALDIERHLLSHHDIMDVAVIGLPDDTWGQIVTAVVVTTNDTTLTLDDLKTWCADKMATYHIPKVLHCLEEMPRNSMGKVNKKQLAKDLFPEYFKQ